jgi:ABC-type multidrug transport system ATPase subunit
MTISEIGIKGYKSFGNNEQILKLNTDKGELILLVGNNGNGKSVTPNTKIEIEMPLESLNLEDFNKFLEIMGKESKYILYIKENNYSLYEQYINQ